MIAVPPSLRPDQAVQERHHTEQFDLAIGRHAVAVDHLTHGRLDVFQGLQVAVIAICRHAGEIGRAAAVIRPSAPPPDLITGRQGGSSISPAMPVPIPACQQDGSRRLTEHEAATLSHSLFGNGAEQPDGTG